MNPQIGDTVTHPLGDWTGVIEQVGGDVVGRWIYDDSGLVLHNVEGTIMLVRVTESPAPGGR